MCSLQFTCTNLYGSQKEGGNFLNLLQKEGSTWKGGRGDLNTVGNYVSQLAIVLHFQKVT